MKKLFIVLAGVSTRFISCNSAAENQTFEDSVTVNADSISTPAIDTLAAKIDSAIKK